MLYTVALRKQCPLAGMNIHEYYVRHAVTLTVVKHDIELIIAFVSTVVAVVAESELGYCFGD